MIIIHPSNRPDLDIFLSDEDADLGSYNWSVPINKKKQYIGSPNSGKKILSRIIAERMGLEIKGKKVIHKDNNALNAQRNNLRVSDHSQMMANSKKKRKSDTNYRGVKFRERTKNYEAMIRHNGILICLGYFDTAIEAAKERDKKAKQLQGEFAKLNFPD